MRHAVRIVVVLASAQAAACYPPPPEPYPDAREIQWEGQYLDFAADESMTVCGGTREYLDDQLGRLGAISGLDMDRVRYFVIPADEVQERCLRRDGGTSWGCAGARKVFTHQAAHVHELVHAVKHAQEGFPAQSSSLFEEGLANAYAKPEDDFPGYLSSDLETFLGSRPEGIVGGQLSVVSSYYVSALSEAFGDRRTWNFVTDTERIKDNDSVRTIFEDHFSASFDDFNARFLENDQCSRWANARHLLECEQDGPDLTVDNGEIEILATSADGQITCDDPEVLGPRNGLMWTTRTLDVPEPIEAAFSFAFEEHDGWADPIDERSQIHIIRCNDRCGLDYYTNKGDPGLGLQEWEAGRYLVRFVRAIDDPGFGGVYISTQRPFPSEEE